MQKSNRIINFLKNMVQLLISQLNKNTFNEPLIAGNTR